MRNTEYYKNNYHEKINLILLIKTLISDVDIVDELKINENLKINQYSTLASDFKKKLYNDEQKNNEPHLNNRITLKTYSTYLSRTRKFFENKIHHSLHEKIKSLSKKHPTYSDFFNQCLINDAKEIKKIILKLQNKFNNGVILLEKYTTSKPKFNLINEFPEWSESILNGTINEDFYICENVLSDLKKLKINHEIMYHLTLNKNDKAAIQAMEERNLKRKKRNSILINYKSYMNAILSILSLPNDIFKSKERINIAPLAFALAAVSGRRMIEILLTGEFKKISKYTVLFKGQVKKRDDTDFTEREIYTLIDSDLFIKKIEFLRSLPAINDKNNFSTRGNDFDDKLINKKIIMNSIFASPLNTFTKKFFNDENRVFKDTRSIYTRIAYEKYFDTDERWKHVDEDVFFSEILGHNDERTQLNYKQFKLHDFDINYIPQKNSNIRLINMERIDNEILNLSKKGGAVKIHNWVGMSTLFSAKIIRSFHYPVFCIQSVIDNLKLSAIEYN